MKNDEALLHIQNRLILKFHLSETETA